MTGSGTTSRAAGRRRKRAGLVALGAVVSLAIGASGSARAASDDGPGQTIPAIAISAGYSHACAILSGGTAACWGVTHTTKNLAPVAVSGLGKVIAITAGPGHNCAVLADGTAKCWGQNPDGELGNGTTTDSLTPVTVLELRHVIAISAGSQHTCAVLTGGTVECWGSNTKGQLGNGTTTDSSTPVAVSGLNDAVAISAGLDHTCADLSDGTVKCWGDNSYGELGNGTTTDSSTPVVVSGLSNATAISGGKTHTCAVMLGGGAECWGSNSSGQLGTGTKTSSSTPVNVAGLGTASTVSTGTMYTCAVLKGGGADCWGYNGLGQLGNGTTTDSSLPDGVWVRAAAAPKFGRTTNLRSVSGTVRVRLPGTTTFVALKSTSTLPVGTTIDATNGKVRLTSAKDAGGHSQSGLVYGGIFTIKQTRGRSPFHPGKKVGLTILTLAGPRPSCTSAAGASAKHRHVKSREVWGDLKGNYGSVGKNGAALVGGTKWLTRDTCAGTLFRVARGVISVTDFVRHRTVRVRAPHSYLARSRRTRSTTRGSAATIEGLLAQLARGRAQLKSALGGAVGCSLSSRNAGLKVDAVIRNRAAIGNRLRALNPPTAQVATVVARLKAAVSHSIVADRHYRDWLTGLDRTHTTACPPPQTVSYRAAGRQDARATTAKQRFVAAFNPLSRRQHLRTWQPDEF